MNRAPAKAEPTPIPATAPVLRPGGDEFVESTLDEVVGIPAAVVSAVIDSLGVGADEVGELLGAVFCLARRASGEGALKVIPVGSEQVAR